MRNSFLYISLSLVFHACENNQSTLLDNNVVYEQNSVNSEINSELFFDSNHILIDYVEAVNDSGNTEIFAVQQIQQQREDIIFRAKRIPKKLYLLNKGVPPTELEGALSKLENEELFYFEFEETQKQDLLKKYFEADMDFPVSYLSFEIYRDFFLVDSKGDSIPAAYATYERNFHVAPFEKLLIGFSNVDEGDEFRLVYQDQLFEKGKTEFSFASVAYIKNNTKQPS